MPFSAECFKCIWRKFHLSHLVQSFYCPHLIISNAFGRQTQTRDNSMHKILFFHSLSLFSFCLSYVNTHEGLLFSTFTQTDTKKEEEEEVVDSSRLPERQRGEGRRMKKILHPERKRNELQRSPTYRNEQWTFTTNRISSGSSGRMNFCGRKKEGKKSTENERRSWTRANERQEKLFSTKQI